MILALAVVTVRPAYGQTATDLSGLSLEDLMNVKVETVVGASKYRQRLTEAPASVTIVTADEIAAQRYRSVADVLRSVRGFYVTYDRNYHYIGTRGFVRPGDYNSRILVLIDGHRLNDNIFGGALIGQEFPVDINLVDRIEVVRGPGSALYGSSAMFGVVNVITRRAAALPGTTVSFLGGGQQTAATTVSYGRLTDGGTSMLASVSTLRSHGARDLYYPEFGASDTAGHVWNADRTRRINGLVNWARGGLSVQALYGVREKHVPTAAFGARFNDPDTRTVDGQGFVDASYSRVWRNGVELAGRVFADRYQYSGYLAYEGDGQPVMNHDMARGSWWGGELRLSKRLWRRHRATAGVEFRDDLRQRQRNYDLTPFTEYLDDSRDSDWRSFFAEDEWLVNDRVRVHLGMRRDAYSDVPASMNPRAGLILSPGRTTTVKLLYGEAFRAPTVYELYWVQADVTKANPALGHEEMRNTEVVLEQHLGAHWRLSANAFLLRVRGLVDQFEDVDGLLTYRNRGAVDGSGVEVELEGRWANGVLVRGSHTLQRSRNPLTGESLTNSPGALFQSSVTVPLARHGASASMNLQAMSRRTTLSGAVAPAYAITNLAVSVPRLRSRLELGASVWNLFNRVYADPGGEEHRQALIPQDGRVVGVTARIRF